MKAPAGMVLFRIADISVMWLLADVPEYELGSVKVGQPVLYRVNGYGDKKFTGVVKRIDPSANDVTRQVEVLVGQLALLLRGKYLVDAVGYNHVRGLPLKAAELAEAIGQLVAEAEGITVDLTTTLNEAEIS